jgi:predicted NUDIX family NTP pyrophosphohydrolase
VPARSAGLLLHRPGVAGVELLLVHPGGPFWRSRDAGAWQIPKGMVEPGEDDETAARREAAEELGIAITAPLLPLGEARQSGGKIVVAFVAAMDVDVAAVRSMEVEIEWPPRSGRRLLIPEVDEARWFTLDDARRAMLPSQQPLLDRLAALIDADPARSAP